MILIRNGELFAPEAKGIRDILIGGNQILAIEETIDPKTLPGEIRVVDAFGMIVVPGFIDGHQHFTGGGGEGGFHTRTPEMQLSMNIANGVTTAVGLLGTDSLTRTVESLYAKTRAFNAEGMTAFMLTGSYWLPSPTVCGSVGRDLVYLDPVIGVKLAMADQRGPHFDAHDLASLASDVRVAALVADKPGIITVHVGVNTDALDLIFEVVEHHNVRPDIFIPTHINRKNARATEQALALAEQGAVIDATCMAAIPGDGPGEQSSTKLCAADFAMIADGHHLFDQVTFSSDAGGSLPLWNKDRSRILGMGIGTPESLLVELRHLVNTRGMAMERALKPMTTTPARIYGLTGTKGAIQINAHADILVLDPDDLGIRDVVAKGQIMMNNGKLERKGYFE